MAKTKVELELSKTLSVKKKATEDLASYQKRLIEAADDLDDDEFGKLSTDAQAWVQAGTKALKTKKKVLPDFEDGLGGDKEKEEDEDEEKEDEEDEDEKKSDDEEDEDEEEKVAAKKTKRVAAKGKRGSGLPVREAEWRKPFFKAIVTNPKLSLDDILKKISDKHDDVSKSQANHIRKVALSLLRVMSEMGKYDRPVPPPARGAPAD